MFLYNLLMKVTVVAFTVNVVFVLDEILLGNVPFASQPAHRMLILSWCHSLCIRGCNCLRHSVEPGVSVPLLPVVLVGNHLISSLILKPCTV